MKLILQILYIVFIQAEVKLTVPNFQPTYIHYLLITENKNNWG